MRFFVAALLVSRVCSAQTESGSLTGTVTDFTGAGIPNTIAKLIREGPPKTQYTTDADEKGKFRFEGLPAGVYALRLDHTGFERLSITSIAISAGQQTQLPPIALPVGCIGCCGPEYPPNFRFLPIASSPGSIVGEVRASRKAPLAGATVTLFCEGSSCGETRTDSQGRFRFANAPTGHHILKVQLAGFYPGATRVTVHDGFESSTWQVTLERCRDKACDPARRPKHPIVVCE